MVFNYSEGFDDGYLKSVTSLFSHSILKQLLTSGSSYVMTFTTFLSLKDQGLTIFVYFKSF